MKFRDHRTGFDTVMFAAPNSDGHMTLELHYRTPKLDAVIELDREDAAAMGAYLLSEFSLSQGAARRRLYEALNNLAPGAAETAKEGDDIADRTIKHSGQNAATGVAGLMEGLTEAPAWMTNLVNGLAGARPNVTNITNVSHQPERLSYWRRVWNAVRGH